MPFLLHARRGLHAVTHWAANFVALLIVLIAISAIILIGFPLVLAVIALVLLLGGALHVSRCYRR